MVQGFGLTRSTTNQFYHHTSLGQCIYLIVYVDDIVIRGNDQNGIKRLNNISSATFRLKTWGNSSIFWGLRQLNLNPAWL